MTTNETGYMHSLIKDNNKKHFISRYIRMMVCHVTTLCFWIQFNNALQLIKYIHQIFIKEKYKNFHELKLHHRHSNIAYVYIISSVINTFYCFSWLIYMVLQPISTIFQLYHGGQFYQWRKPEYPEKTTIVLDIS